MKPYFALFAALMLTLPAAQVQAQTSASPWQLSPLAGGNAVGDAGAAREASLRFVQGLAVAANGDVYLADADDHRVRVIRAASGLIETVAGDGFPGTGARLNTPFGLALTASGELIIADLGNAQIRRLNADGSLTNLPGPAYVAPRNVVAAPAGRIYVSDFGANRVYRIEADGRHFALPPPTPNFSAPAGLALDPAGNLYIADSGNGRVLRYSNQGVYTEFAATLGNPTGLAWHNTGALLITDARGDFLTRQPANGEATRLPLGGRDVATDSSGNVYTAQGAWVRKLSANGLLEILTDPRYQTFRGENVAALQARLHLPTGLAKDSQGNVYFCDTGNHRVRVVRNDGRIATVAGTGEPGFAGDGGPGVRAQLNTPTALAVDSFDNLYIADTLNHRVRVLSSSGVLRTVAGNGRAEFSLDGLPPTEAALSLPSGLAVDAEGRILVAERGAHRVRRFTLAGRIETLVGSGVRGPAAETDQATIATFNEPTALALDGEGRLYIVDRANLAIRRFDPTTGRLSTLLGQLADPAGLAVAADGTLYYAEARRHTVSRWQAGAPPVLLAGRAGENGLNAEAGEALALTLNEPTGLLLLNSHTLVLADRLNHRLRLLTGPPPAPAGSEVPIEPAPVRQYLLTHAATFAPSPLVPGLLMTLFTPPLANPISAVIEIDGFPAPISFRGAGQVNFQVPYAVAGRSAAPLTLRHAGAEVHREVVMLAAAAPGLFTNGPNGEALAVLPNGALNGPANPARAGDILTLYGTGDGLRTVRNGQEVPFQTVSVTLGGQPAEVLYAGAAPGFPGLLQLNVKVPELALRETGAVPIQLRVGTATSPTGTTIVLR
ncbi:MAG: hypothetical protein OHK0021_12760 [Bryobacter sp.]